MPITISGSTGIAGVDGSAATPAVQGTDTNTGIYYPAADQVAIATNGTQQMLVNSAGIITGTAGNLMLVSATSQASTSGTSIDFTGIPSWAKRITVMFSGVSTGGTSNIQIQIGSGSFTTSGYNQVGTTFAAAGANVVTGSTGFILGSISTSAFTLFGAVVITNLTSNTWVCQGSVANVGDSRVHGAQGGLALGGVLDRVRITTINGTDIFDAGSINILYE
jgi:hypothetical protein